MEIFEDYSSDKLKFTDTGAQIELDIFVPSLSLAFEYQVMLLVLVLIISRVFNITKTRKFSESPNNIIPGML